MQHSERSKYQYHAWAKCILCMIGHSPCRIIDRKYLISFSFGKIHSDQASSQSCIYLGIWPGFNDLATRIQSTTKPPYLWLRMVTILIDLNLPIHYCPPWNQDTNYFQVHAQLLHLCPANNLTLIWKVIRRLGKKVFPPLILHRLVDLGFAGEENKKLRDVRMGQVVTIQA